MVCVLTASGAIELAGLMFKIMDSRVDELVIHVFSNLSMKTVFKQFPIHCKFYLLF